MNRCIKDALQVAKLLSRMADEHEAHAKDSGCAVVAGVMRDCAYKIRGIAERERDAHRLKGVWRQVDERPVALSDEAADARVGEVGIQL